MKGCKIWQHIHKMCGGTGEVKINIFRLFLSSNLIYMNIYIYTHTHTTIYLGCCLLTPYKLKICNRHRIKEKVSWTLKKNHNSQGKEQKKKRKEWQKTKKW